MHQEITSLRQEQRVFQESLSPLLFPEIIRAQPFLKWAGGKTQLLPELINLLPVNFNKYIEPFVGGGALFFRLNHANSVIADSNAELIITYKQIREDVQGVISILDTYQNNANFFYEIRSSDVDKLSLTERAARMIFLNKTCFNGLFRVNKKGEFNVPYANNKNVSFNTQNLFAVSEVLKNTKIIHSDYQEVVSENADKGDFIFLDPPYQPVGKYSDFKRYTKEFFYEKDQIELAIEFKKLVDKGCYVILTNSDHPMIIELYKDFEIRVIQTKRLINRNASARKGTDIIVVGN